MCGELIWSVCCYINCRFVLVSLSEVVPLDCATCLPRVGGGLKNGLVPILQCRLTGRCPFVLLFRDFHGHVNPNFDLHCDHYAIALLHSVSHCLPAYIAHDHHNRHPKSSPNCVHHANPYPKQHPGRLSDCLCIIVFHLNSDPNRLPIALIVADMFPNPISHCFPIPNIIAHDHCDLYPKSDCNYNHHDNSDTDCYSHLHFNSLHDPNPYPDCKPKPHPHPLTNTNTLCTHYFNDDSHFDPDLNSLRNRNIHPNSKLLSHAITHILSDPNSSFIPDRYPKLNIIPQLEPYSLPIPICNSQFHPNFIPNPVSNPNPDSHSISVAIPIRHRELNPNSNPNAYHDHDTNAYSDPNPYPDCKPKPTPQPLPNANTLCIHYFNDDSHFDPDLNSLRNRNIHPNLNPNSESKLLSHAITHTLSDPNSIFIPDRYPQLNIIPQLEPYSLPIPICNSQLHPNFIPNPVSNPNPDSHSISVAIPIRHREPNPNSNPNAYHDHDTNADSDLNPNHDLILEHVSVSVLHIELKPHPNVQPNAQSHAHSEGYSNLDADALTDFIFNSNPYTISKFEPDLHPVFNAILHLVTDSDSKCDSNLKPDFLFLPDFLIDLLLDAIHNSELNPITDIDAVPLSVPISFWDRHSICDLNAYSLLDCKRNPISVPNTKCNSNPNPNTKSFTNSNRIVVSFWHW